MKKCILGMYVEEYQDHAVEIHTFAMNVLLGRCDPPPPNPHWTYFSIILGSLYVYLHMYTWRSAKCKRLLVSNVACQQHAVACQQHRVYMYIHIHMYKWSPTKLWEKMANCQYFSTFPRTVPAYVISLKRHVCMQ